MFLSNIVLGQENLSTSKVSNPGFYEILSPGQLDDTALEQFCYKLNKEANMANYFDSNTLLQFNNGVEILFFKTYRELNDFKAKLKRDASKTLSPGLTIKQQNFPEKLKEQLTLLINR